MPVEDGRFVIAKEYVGVSQLVNCLDRAIRQDLVLCDQGAVDIGKEQSNVGLTHVSLHRMGQGAMVRTCEWQAVIGPIESYDVIFLESLQPMTNATVIPLRRATRGSRSDLQRRLLAPTRLESRHHRRGGKRPHPGYGGSMLRPESWTRPVGVSPTWVIAGEPSSRPQSAIESHGPDGAFKSLFGGASVRESDGVVVLAIAGRNPAGGRTRLRSCWNRGKREGMTGTAPSNFPRANILPPSKCDNSRTDYGLTAKQSKDRAFHALYDRILTETTFSFEALGAVSEPIVGQRGST